MKIPGRFGNFGVVGAVSLASGFVGYGVIFTFYVAGLFGDGQSVSPLVWERTLRGTLLMGSALTVFLIFGVAAWLLRFRTGILPWTVGALATLLIARWDAGIFDTLDLVWVALFVVLAAVAGRHEQEDDEEDEEDRLE
ncbi:MAG: hypothetical protein JNK60_20295 [Acidobacteria bacterium]|nr:hypothetical protein [Acidobacteriota bacterium]